MWRRNLRREKKIKNFFAEDETKREAKASYRQKRKGVYILQEGSLPMEPKNAVENLWRIWVDTNRRIVSFHEEEGCQMLEFRSHDMFLSCVDQYSGKRYRYQ